MPDESGKGTDAVSVSPEARDGIPDRTAEAAGGNRYRLDHATRWVPVGAYNNPVAAHLARIRLDFDGIDCYLDNELFVSTAWVYGNATGGVKVMVREADADAARQSLRAKVPHAGPDAGGRGVGPESLCPHCGSADVVPDRPWKRLLAASLVMIAAEGAGIVFLVLGIPLIVAVALWSAVSLPWKCEACAHYGWRRVNAKGFDVLSERGTAERAALPVLPFTPPPATGQ